MSLPLPLPTRRRGEENGGTSTPADGVRASWQFLDPDERYEVHRVKMAERPHLLLLPPQDGDDCDRRHGHGDEHDGAGDSNCGDDDDGSPDGSKDARSSPYDAPADETPIVVDGDAQTHPPISNGRRPGGPKFVPPVACGVENVNESPPLPLIDGTDIPGWRAGGMVKLRPSLAEHVDPVLNVGASSTFFRRDSQWPVVLQPPPHRSWGGYGGGGGGGEGTAWDALRDGLSVPPPPGRDAPIVEYGDACEPVAAVVADGVPSTSDRGRVRRRRTRATRFAVDFERGNVPAKILGAAKDWRAMPPRRDDDDDSVGGKDGVGTVKAGCRCDCGGMDRVCDDPSRCGGDEGGVGGGWTFDNLLERFGHVMWRFSDTHGEMLSLETYAKYLHGIEGLLDDSPLAVYDSEFGDADSPSTNELVGEYSVPECFSDDLFALVEEDSGEGDDDVDEGDGDDDGGGTTTAVPKRPPYRWILIGPERSGTGMHVDPLWTNAWVTVLEGRKRWILFPPATPPEEVGMIDGRPQIPSSIWFRDYYEKVTDEKHWPEEWRPVEVLQGPGEAVFVPAGWMHAVLNLDLTVAVTHNYASEHGPAVFEGMWRRVVIDEPAFARRWYRALGEARPDLADRARRFHRACGGCEGEGWTKLVDLDELR